MRNKKKGNVGIDKTVHSIRDQLLANFSQIDINIILKGIVGDIKRVRQSEIGSLHLSTERNEEKIRNLKDVDSDLTF